MSVDWNTKIAEKTLNEELEKIAKQYSGNVAIDFMGIETSYGELYEKICNLAANLKNKLGVKKGDKIGIFLPNCPQFLISYFAILKIGATVVNFSPLYADPELEHQLKDSKTKYLITLNLEALFGKAKNLLGKHNLKKIIVSPLADYFPKSKKILFKIFRAGQISKVKYGEDILCFEDFLQKGEKIKFPKLNPKEDVAVLQYTGGTTGTPKGAVLTHYNIYANAKQSQLWCQVDEVGEGVILAVLPFFHIFAMTTTMNYGVLQAAKIILHPKFELLNVLKDINNKKPTLMPGVPTMYNAIGSHKKVKRYDLSSLKLCICGGDSLPVEVKKIFEKLTGCKLVEGYGLTESSPVVSCNPVDSDGRYGSIGLPFPQTEIAIVSLQDGKTHLPIGEKGELCVKGPQVMKEYWQNKKETKKVLRDGWLHTGDVAQIAEDGYITIVDRIKELIISGGFNIYPSNIENAIYKHPDILEASVIGVKDKKMGQMPKAFIVLKKGKNLTQEELQQFLKKHLAKYEMPKKYQFCKELPKTMIGKISKKDL